MSEPDRSRRSGPPPSPALMRAYKTIGVVVPLLGALIGGLLAHHSDRAYESDTGKTLSAGTVRGDVIAGALSGFMLAVIVTFLVLLVVSAVLKRRRGRGRP